MRNVVKVAVVFWLLLQVSGLAILAAFVAVFLLGR